MIKQIYIKWLSLFSVRGWLTASDDQSSSLNSSFFGKWEGHGWVILFSDYDLRVSFSFILMIILILIDYSLSQAFLDYERV